MMSAAVFRHTDPAPRSFAAILLLGGLAGGAAVAAAVVLSLNVLIPFASACIQACTTRSRSAGSRPPRSR